MARAPQLRVSGGAELRRALKEAEGSLRDLNAVHRRVAIVVATAAAARAPRRTGRLAYSVKGKGSSNRAIVEVGGNVSKGIAAALEASREVNYGGPIHWGWPSSSKKLPRSMRALSRTWAIAPNPWIVRAARETESTWVPMYERELSDIIDTIGEKSDGRGA